MIRGNKILVIITARSGSKRLIGKNLKLLVGRPLVEWTIEFASKIHGVDEIIVSTDSYEIAAICNKFGMIVPPLRPAEFSTDESTSVDVIKYELKRLEAIGKDFDFFILLQPTSPFRKLEYLIEGIQKSIMLNGVPVISISKARTNPYWLYKLDNNNNLKPILIKDNEKKSEFKELDTYEVNGNFYIMGVKKFLKDEKLFTEDAFPIILENPIYSCDIDDEYDWLMAETIAHRYYNKQQK